MKMPVRLTRGKRRGGFTLVEVIVVLIILAILAAILIPSLTGYIDKAHQKAAISECRQCVEAAQTIATEKYAAGGALSLADDEDAVLALAEAPSGGDITSLELTGGAKVKKLVYKTAGGYTVTYEDGKYTVDGDGGSSSKYVKSLGNSETLGKVMEIFSSSGASKLDSGASTTDGTKSKAVVDALAAEDVGINLKDLDATSWRYNSSTGILYWTPADISGMAADSKCPVMRYNSKTDTYTVFIAVINKDGGSYNTIKSEGSIYYASKLHDGSQTYENMLADYADAVAHPENWGKKV